MLALLGEAEAHGAALALKSPLRARRGARRRLPARGGRRGADAPGDWDSSSIRPGCTPRRSPRRSPASSPATCRPCAMAKGNYFTLAGRAPFSRLVYPLPEPGGLGVHLTLDLGGQARFGPDVEWVERHRLRRRPAPRRRASTPKSASTGRGCPTAPCSRPMPASGPSSAGPASRRPISWCSRPARTACRGW
jgi:hypothetical protein